MAQQIYILDPDTGAQIGYFAVPNLDEGGPTAYNNGYALGFTASDTLFIYDGNVQPNGTFPTWLTTADGTVLAFSQLYLPTPDGACAPYCGPQSFAVGSDGNAYIVIYYVNVIYKINSALELVEQVAIAGQAYPSTADLAYDTVLVVSWGAAPESDLFYCWVICGRRWLFRRQTGAL